MTSDQWEAGAAVFTAICGFVGSVLYAHSKVKDLEADVAAIKQERTDHPVVTISSCELMKTGCKELNKLHFEHGQQEFAALRTLIKESQEASECRYRKLFREIESIKNSMIRRREDYPRAMGDGE